VKCSNKKENPEAGFGAKLKFPLRLTNIVVWQPLGSINEAEGARTLNLRIDRLMLRIHNLLETQDLPKYTIWAYPQAYLEC